MSDLYEAGKIRRHRDMASAGHVKFLLGDAAKAMRKAADGMEEHLDALFNAAELRGAADMIDEWIGDVE